MQPLPIDNHSGVGVGKPDSIPLLPFYHWLVQILFFTKLFKWTSFYLGAPVKRPQRSPCRVYQEQFQAIKQGPSHKFQQVAKITTAQGKIISKPHHWCPLH